MSLRRLMKERLINYVIKDAQSKMKKKYTLIVGDEYTIKILDHCFKMHELNDLGVGVVLNVKYNRERVRVSPIYFLSNEYESSKKMVEDYADPKKTTYAAPVHIYYCQKISTRIMELIKSSKIKGYLKTFMEIPCDFFVLERNVFSFGGEKEAFKSLYMDKEKKSDELAKRAEQLVGLCLTLNENPYICYSSSRNSKSLADLFKNSFENVRHKLTKFTPNQKRGTLIIIDRSDDPLTPLMHSLSFQPMIMDLLNNKIIDNGKKIKLEDNKEEEIKDNNNNNKNERKMPDEQDSIWVQYRHEFIGKVVQELPEQFKKWQKENAVVKMKELKNSGKMDSKALLNAAKSMPQYKQLITSYTTNISLASQLSNIFKNTGLDKIISLEQDIATGIDENGKKCDRTKIQTQFCNDVLMNNNIDELLKLRIFMMYVIAQGGMKPQQRKQLLSQSGFNDNAESTIINLSCLGVTLQDNKPKSGHKNKEYWKYLENIAKSKVETTEIIRYTSYLEYILIANNNNELLKSDHFAWFEKPKQTILQTNVVHSWRRKKPDNNNDNNSNNNNTNDQLTTKGANIIIYILGGASYYELKDCYKFSKSKNINVYIGSTQIISPQQYINNLKDDSNSNNDQI